MTRGTGLDILSCCDTYLGVKYLTRALHFIRVGVDVARCPQLNSGAVIPFILFAVKSGPFRIRFYFRI
jgi:hypothetical protein